MIVIEPEDAGSVGIDLPDQIAGDDLLRACVGEAQRQASLLVMLDDTLGNVVDLVRRAQRGDTITEDDLPGLRVALQLADQVRQESEGLHRALHLLTQHALVPSAVAASAIAQCTSLHAQRTRFLSAGKNEGASLAPHRGMAETKNGGS